MQEKEIFPQGQSETEIIAKLSAYKVALYKEELAEEQIIRAKARAKKLNSPLAMVTGGGELSAIDKALSIIETAEERWLEAVGKTETALQNVEHIISLVRVKKQQEVLTYMYIEDKTAKEISEKIGYSASHIRRLHKDAIKWLQKNI